ncbi:adhesion G protein-coupled receptor G3 isoform X3 [Sapajus apella]|uniref:Adhesion G protein-coupled receptor G3 isoform X3 n=1 Tax=Sapajus apella TaxID=9515 RepID=A0A6J3IC35_SAPAP|nr:adhesion G protein-coupled receptor G3 isoform X3 [Sapajus apella]
MAPLSRKGEKEDTGSQSGGAAGWGQASSAKPGARGPDSCRTLVAWARMAMPRALGALLLQLLLLLALGQENHIEEPRHSCLGDSLDEYGAFDLKDKAGCFTKCRQSESEPCDVGNLQKYWLNYEAHLVEETLTEKVNMSFLKALVQNVSTSTAEDLYFSLKPSQVPRQVMKDEDKPPDRVRLPKSLFESLPGNRSAVRLAITVLDIGLGTLFKGPQLSLGDGSSVLNNRLVGLSVGRMHVTRLAEPLEIIFSHQRPPPNMTFTCVFWDATKGPTGDWASEGCSTEVGPEGTVCRCDHLTFFTLLLRPILDQSTVQILTRISQAGCGVSMIFLAFTIVLYAVLSPGLGHGLHPQQAERALPAGCVAGPCERGLERQEKLPPAPQGGAWYLRLSRQRFKSEDAPKIHVALSGSLFLLNLAFLITVGSGSKGSDTACWARGAVYHYFLLCVFTWMGLEAFHLYLLAVRVFNTYFGHYFLKLSLVGWGLPALMVIGTGSANSYGLYTIRDRENRTSLELCLHLLLVHRPLPPKSEHHSLLLYCTTRPSPLRVSRIGRHGPAIWTQL